MSKSNSQLKAQKLLEKKEKRNSVLECCSEMFKENNENRTPYNK